MDQQPGLIPGLEPGGDVAVLGAGASLTPEAAESVRRIPCLAVNHAYLRAPWAAALYAHDATFWRDEPGAAAFAGAKLAGQRCEVDGVVNLGQARELEVQLRPGHVVHLVNSGLEAIRIAASCRPRRIYLLGFDREGGHFHNRYPSEPSSQTLAIWAAAVDQLGDRLARDGIELVRGAPGGETGPARTPLEVFGMAGIGDNLHQRAVVRELARTREVWLRTPWPQLYHDLNGIRLVPHELRSRVSDKNSAAAARLYATDPIPPGAAPVSIGYGEGRVQRLGSVVAVMASSVGVTPGKFDLPVPEDWKRAARARVKVPKGRRLLVYRPLTERADMPATAARNPDPVAYKAIFDQLRPRFYVVSVADLEPGQEWQISLPIEPDLELHCGELALEGLIGLFAIASLVYTAPGMATVLAQAVQTCAITVFGGYETAASFSHGAGPRWLAVEPDRPCGCWNAAHACDKAIDIPAAIARVEAWLP